MAQIYPLSEGEFTVGHNKEFIPFNPQFQELTDRSIGSLHVEVQPFLVCTKEDIIILDTGLGLKNEKGILQIHDNLKKTGIEHSEVTKVLLSHLHKDHASGLVYTDNNGNIKSTFQFADYYIYRPEMEIALQTGLPSYNILNIESLLATGQVKWLEGITGNITNEIHFFHSGGHCPQHIVFLIDDGIDKVFYGGDEAPQLKQMKVKYVAKYDTDGKKALALREQYAEQGKKEGWKFLFYHDVKSPIATL